MTAANSSVPCALISSLFWDATFYLIGNADVYCSHDRTSIFWTIAKAVIRNYSNFSHSDVRRRRSKWF